MLVDALGRPEAFFTSDEHLSVKFLYNKLFLSGGILLAAIVLYAKSCKAMMAGVISLQATLS